MTESHYKLLVSTGNGRYHGTDSKIEITLFGEKGEKHARLVNSLTNKNPFENKSVDEFVIESKDLGYIHKVLLKSDGTGKGSSWYVKEVEITYFNEKTNKTKKFSFSFNRWFSKKQGLEHFAYTLESPVLGITAEKDYRARHHTSDFQLIKTPNLFLFRRGLTVVLDIALKRALDEKQDDFAIVLETGRKPRESNKSLVIIPRCDESDFEKNKTQNQWAYKVLSTIDFVVSVDVFIPSDALVARYDMSIELNEETKYKSKDQVVILFNPWCPDDEVFMDSDEDLKEYILSAEGYVYQGAARQPYPKGWYFGQFEDVVLDTAFYLLENDVKINGRDTAAKVARLVSAKCNSIDNDGILEGNWSGDYSGGKSPSFWNTTPAILLQYVENGYKPVQYGQCWVFSAIMTGLMRALGIPCRSVTNFSSAHDTDANVTIDVYFDENNERDEELSSDSIWNFHVWNDAWMKRNDLRRSNVDDMDVDVNFDGWQAIDGTPQEESGGIFQMGPAPLSAIKEGKVDTVYDTKFVFAEVNGEQVYYRKPEGGGEFVPFKVRSDVIGRNISTKRVNHPYRHDITDEYKYKDGSILERNAVKNALRLVDHPIVAELKESMTVEVKASKDDYYVGQDIEVNVKIQNFGDTDKSCKLSLKAKLVRYNGNPVINVKIKDDSQRKIKVLADNSSVTSFTIPAENYWRYLKENDFIRIHGIVTNIDTNNITVDDDTVSILRPDIEITNVPDHVISNEPMTMTISFQNPLDVELEECESHIGGMIVPEPIYDLKIPNVPAGGRYVKDYKFDILKINGFQQTKKLFYSFSCKQLGGFSKSVDVVVSDPQ